MAAQLLCITCDNASLNDVMINNLSRNLMNYPGDAHRARCFNHVIALVAKRITRQFDVPKGEADGMLDEAEKELRELAKGVDIEEALMRGQGTDMDDNDDDDDIESEETLLDGTRTNLEASTRPVRLVLVKVGHLNTIYKKNWTQTNWG
jgi:hypothetical protein